jgi:hypothetical protein
MQFGPFPSCALDVCNSSVGCLLRAIGCFLLAARPCAGGVYGLEAHAEGALGLRDVVDLPRPASCQSIPMAAPRSTIFERLPRAPRHNYPAAAALTQPAGRGTSRGSVCPATGGRGMVVAWTARAGSRHFRRFSALHNPSKSTIRT